MRITLNDNVSLEPVGEDVLVLDSTRGVVERFDGDQASILLQLSRGEVLDLDSSQGLENLLHAGVVKQVGAFSRRKAVTLGAAAAGATFVSLSLPTAAMAQSVESPEFGFVVSFAQYDGDGTIVDLDLAESPESPLASEVTFELSFVSETDGFTPTTDLDGFRLTFDLLPSGFPEEVDAWIRWRLGDVISQVRAIKVIRD
jgi:hypothetical protein